jgi:hypothetical protein
MSRVSNRIPTAESFGALPYQDWVFYKIPEYAVVLS